MNRNSLFKRSLSRLIWAALIAFITYQVAFTWVPLWKNATILQGTDVSEVQIVNENGQRIYLAEFKGKPLIINFWASWCIPCRLEIPLLNGIYPRLLKGNKQLIGVNQSESRETIDTFQANTTIAFPVYRDTGELSKLLNIEVIPAIAVIDSNGKVQSMTYGFRPWIQVYLLWWI